MTVDMLAATFFWPEGTLLGSRQPDPDGEAAPAAEPAAAAEAAEQPGGFWPAVMRHLRRPAPAARAAAPAD